MPELWPGTALAALHLASGRFVENSLQRQAETFEQISLWMPLTLVSAFLIKGRNRSFPCGPKRTTSDKEKAPGFRPALRSFSV